MKKVTPREASKLMDEGYVYVDVRSEPEFEAGHAKGAYNIPILRAGDGGLVDNTDFLKVFSANFPKDTKLILACQTNRRSARAVEALVANGYVDCTLQVAGWAGSKDGFGQVEEPGWPAANLPVEAGNDGERGYEALAKKAGIR